MPNGYCKTFEAKLGSFRVHRIHRLGMSLEHVAVEFLEDREVVLATWLKLYPQYCCSQQNYDNVTTCVSRTRDLVD